MTTKPLILIVAEEMAAAVTANAQIQVERRAAGFFLRLTRIDGQRRLVVARRDRQPSLEEMTAIAQAAGAPALCEPIATFASMTAQDGTVTRLPGLVVGWRQI